MQLKGLLYYLEAAKYEKDSIGIHITNYGRLRSILKHGLVAPKKNEHRNWQDSSGGYLASYGGVYFVLVNPNNENLVWFIKDEIDSMLNTLHNSNYINYNADPRDEKEVNDIPIFIITKLSNKSTYLDEDYFRFMDYSRMIDQTVNSIRENKNKKELTNDSDIINFILNSFEINSITDIEENAIEVIKNSKALQKKLIQYYKQFRVNMKEKRTIEEQNKKLIEILKTVIKDNQKNPKLVRTKDDEIKFKGANRIIAIYSAMNKNIEEEYIGNLNTLDKEARQAFPKIKKGLKEALLSI